MMRINKVDFPNISDNVPIVITNKHGQSEVKEFVYSNDKWYEENECGLYSFDMDMNYDWWQFTETCPQKFVSKINHYVNKIGKLDFIVCGEYGVTAFFKTNIKNIYNRNDYFRLKEWFWKKYKLVFWIVNTNKYYK